MIDPDVAQELLARVRRKWRYRLVGTRFGKTRFGRWLIDLSVHGPTWLRGRWLVWSGQLTEQELRDKLYLLHHKAAQCHRVATESEAAR